MPARLNPPRPFPIHQTPPTMIRNPVRMMNSSQTTSPISQQHPWDSNTSQHQQSLIYPPPTRPPLRSTMSQQYASRYKEQQYSEQDYSGGSNFVQQEEVEEYYRR